MLKSDIENFFETINHDILLKILDAEVKDKSVIRLLSLFMQVGGFVKQDYDVHLHGVYQGDILSPLLSNIYLNEMDSFLEKKNISFVRYADDFALFFKGKNEAYKTLTSLKQFLKTLHLKLGDKKTSVVHISDGFTFLGVEFRGRNREIQEERLQKSLQKLELLSQNKSGFKKYVDELNFYLQGVKNYYLKILTKNSQQHLALQNTLSSSLSHKVFLSKKSKDITTKKEFTILLEQVKLHILFEVDIVKHEIKHIIAIGYEKYLADKSYKDTSSKIAKKKNKYAKKFAKAKNQLNYIKYLNKYHKLMQKQIDSIESSIVKMKTASSVNELMGYEGSISATYWSALKLILEVPFTKRITYGAKDIVNSSLNYGYAFLYGKVQHSLVHAGLNLNISFLHSLDEKKPTLTYDMIEEFRTFIVDRTIVIPFPVNNQNFK